MAVLRKSICILLSAILVLSCCVCVSAASNSSDYSQEAALLTGLGVLNNSSNYEKTVTRAEFAEIIFKLLDLDVISADQQFRNVSKSNGAYDYIQTVAVMGYFSGDSDGKFRPSEPILAEEAVKVMVGVLGYTIPAQEAGGYPDGYLSVARQIGAMYNLDVTVGEELTYGEVARLLYNCLDIELLYQAEYGVNQFYYISDNGTILSDYLHVIDVRGSVRANYNVNLDGSYEIEQGQVVIDNTLYYVGKTDIDAQIGLSVHAYVKLDDTDPVQTVLYYELTSNQKTITVSAEDIQSSTSAPSFVYLDGNRKKTVSVPSDITLIWNGKKRFSFDGETLQPKEGDVTLVMDGNTLTLLIVNSYESKVVQSVSETTKTIYYKNGAASTSLEDQDVQYTIMKKDQKIDIGELEENDIASVAASEDGMVVYIIISNETLTGTVTEISDDKYAIDSMAYPLSEYYCGKTIEVGKEGTFYLNAFGYIVYSEYSTTASDYAFLIAKEYEDGISQKLTVKILTTAGKIEEKTIENKVTFNDVKMNVENVDAQLAANQLIKVQMSSAGEIRSIETAFDNTAVSSPTYDTEVFSKDVSNIELRYKTNMFSDGSNLYCTEDSTIVMVLPVDANGDVIDRECSISTVSKTFSADTRYSDMTFYDLDEDTLVPNIMVRMPVQGASEVSADSSVCIVDEVYTTVDSEGLSMRGLSYYKGGSLYETPVDNDVVSTLQNGATDSSAPSDFQDVTIDDLQKGDVIQIATNIDGYISVFRPVFIQKYAPTDHKQLVSGGGGYSEYPYFETYYGVITNRTSKLITFNLGGTVRNVVGSGTKVYRLNSERNRLEVLTAGDLNDYVNHESVFAHISRKSCQVVVIYD